MEANEKASSSDVVESPLQHVDALNPKSLQSESESEEVEAETSEPFVDPASLTPFNGNELSYDLSSLTWHSGHSRNKQHTYCYCGKPRTKFSVMLKCNQCHQWFHLECLKRRPTYPVVSGDPNYIFKCAICNGGNEYFELTQKSWSDIVRIAIYNLLQQEKKKGSTKRFFQYKDEICHYIDKHWESLCFGKSRTKTWANTIGSALSTKSHYFRSGGEVIGTPGYWGLRDEKDPSLSADAGSKSTKIRKEKQRHHSKFSKKRLASASGLQDDQKPAKLRKTKSTPVPIYLPKVYFDPDRYGYTTVCLAKENSAPQVKIGSDNLTAMNEKGYRMTRASFGVTEGTWYYEIEILSHSGNTRLGWSTEKGDVQAPVGYDKYSYSYRDKEGTKFHQSRGKSYGEPYGPGDIVGCLIRLPPKEQEKKENSIIKTPTPEKKDKIALTSRKEEDDDEPEPLPGSEIVFYKNGVSQGVAFSNIGKGTYYPAAALYWGATVRFHFGPNFQRPPLENISFRPVNDLATIAAERRARQAQQDAEHAATTAAANLAKETIPTTLENKNLPTRSESSLGDQNGVHANPNPSTNHTSVDTNANSETPQVLLPSL